MSTLKVDTIEHETATSAIDMPNKFKVSGNGIEQGYTSSETEPSDGEPGDIWWDSANEKIYRYIDGEFKELTGATSGGSATSYGDRALAAGGNGVSTGWLPYNHDRIFYFDTTTPGNASDFGDLTLGRAYTTGASNGSRGVFIGGHGYIPSTQGLDPYGGNVIDYVTVATTGNATDFGDITRANGQQGLHGHGCVHNSTRAVFEGGRFNADETNTATSGSNDDQYSGEIYYITIATTGNATLFGNLDMSAYSRDTRDTSAGAGNETRGIFSGGVYRNAPFSGGNLYGNVLDYVTIDTTGNSTDFGDLLATRVNHGAAANSTRMLVGGGGVGGSGSSNYSNSIEYVTIDTTGNSIDFGDLTKVRGKNVGTSNGTKAFFIGGQNTSSPYTDSGIDVVTIDTTGNATDHGDLDGTNTNGGSTNYMGALTGAAS